MFKCKIFILFALFLGNYLSIFGQETETHGQKNWFISIDYGIQMSGIKSEDFISSNYSPLIRITGGKWISKNIAIQAGYQGRYFNTIADNERHFYSFYFSEVVLDAKNIFLSKEKKNRFYGLFFHGGFGYFQNHYYENSTVHGILGVMNTFSVASAIKMKLDVGGLIGWDIYQGNKDILPSLTLGIIYNFNR